MKIKSAKFHISAPDIESCPEWALREFAFIGRSNVGKSSMINLLTGKNGLAKVSATPGKTQLLNFFVINESWGLVDLPGYGYAKVNKGHKHAFNEAVADYIEQRTNLACVFVLIDSRLPPQKLDLEFIQWLGGCSIPYALVFTKADKQSPTRTRANVAVFEEQLSEWHTRDLQATFTSSAKDRSGKVEILDFIGKRLAGDR